jgi:hypothetical protein
MVFKVVHVLREQKVRSRSSILSPRNDSDTSDNADGISN